MISYKRYYLGEVSFTKPNIRHKQIGLEYIEVLVLVCRVYNTTEKYEFKGEIRANRCKIRFYKKCISTLHPRSSHIHFLIISL